MLANLVRALRQYAETHPVGVPRFAEMDEETYLAICREVGLDRIALTATTVVVFGVQLVVVPTAARPMLQVVEVLSQGFPPPTEKLAVGASVTAFPACMSLRVS